MCLGFIDKEIKKGNGVGYKCFHRDRQYHLIPMTEGEGRYQFNYWYEDKSDIIINDTFPNQYKTGYHIFVNLYDAKKWLEGENRGKPILKKVKYSDVVASGTQNGVVMENGKVIVARKMLILKDKIDG